MKKIKLLLAASILLFLTNLSFGQTIVGSSHDFHLQNWNTTNEICIVCHTPHNSITTVTDAPLWNHQVTAITNYTLYSSSTFNGAGTITQPNGNSKLCLSCHDGTVALENFGTQTGGTHFISGQNNIGGTGGTHLEDDHPISFTYDANLALADPGLFNPNTTQSGLGGTITATMLFYGKLECASCHDVHNHAGIPHLLRKTNSISALCLTCHNK